MKSSRTERKQLIEQMDDIRFSQRVSAGERVERMNTEIEYLKKLVEIQKHGNKDYTLDRNSLARIASTLIREGNAKGSNAELVGLLEDTYNYISRDANVSCVRPTGYDRKPGYLPLRWVSSIQRN